MARDDKDVVLTIRVGRDLRSAFSAACDAKHVPASQVLRQFMRDFVESNATALETRGSSTKIGSIPKPKG